ncbi:MAG: hypothetical protein WCA79_17640 [Anaerolineales bacterium]
MKYIIVLCILLAAACTPIEQVPATVPTLAPVATPIPITPTLGNCAFVEATQNLPDLTSQVDKAMKELQSGASGRAEAFGENCVYANRGQSVFTAKETDFYFTVNANNLNNNEELGTWIINVMKIIDALPSGSISGPQAGFVEFTFETKDDQKILHIPINKYRNLPVDIKPADVVKTLFSNP